MKTKMKKISLGLIVLMTGTVFSSFIGKSPISTGDSEGKKWEEYGKVRTFAWKTICEPIRVASSKNRISSKEFSRCPSGYQPEFTTTEDSITTRDFVYGTIELYRGCSPKYICDFKICVDKGYAMIKSKGSNAYLKVGEWLEERKKQQQQKDIVMKSL